VTASGLSYSGFNEKTKKHEWNAIRGIYTWEVLMCYNLVDFGRTWNVQTYDWLKNYVLKRMLKKGQNPTVLTSFITFSVSSLWHGFIARYFIFFFVSFLYMEACRASMQCGYFFRWVPSPIKYGIGLFTTQLYAAYTTCMYILTYAAEIHEFNKEIYYWPTVLFTVQFILA